LEPGLGRWKLLSFFGFAGGPGRGAGLVALGAGENPWAEKKTPFFSATRAVGD